MRLSRSLFLLSLISILPFAAQAQESKQTQGSEQTTQTQAGFMTAAQTNKDSSRLTKKRTSTAETAKQSKQQKVRSNYASPDFQPELASNTGTCSFARNSYTYSCN